MIGLLWTACVSIHGWLHVRSSLAHPEQIMEWYASSMRYQLVSFALLYGVFWLFILAAALFFARRARLRRLP
jgi:hypothetical protein